ncbi:hypothetical protein SRHO_G00312640 [Serrasalmus rhombeus]
MDTEGGESLYRATVGLIWYFSWCNVSKGKTKVKSIIYHVCMGADMFHPNCPSLRFGDGDETPSVQLCRVGAVANVLVETDSADIGRRNGADKRMRNMAANFYY